MATPKPRKLKLTKPAADMLAQMERDAISYKKEIVRHNRRCRGRHTFHILFSVPDIGHTGRDEDRYVDGSVRRQSAFDRLIDLGLIEFYPQFPTPRVHVVQKST